MTVWKIRRMNFTPASILSTLTILEVQLRDNGKTPIIELKALYSSALTRFLNYMSSLLLNKQFKSLYATVKELGIEPFIVDLRHLCSHGQVMPALEVFQRTAIYCMEWLKDYYWDRQMKALEDAHIEDIRPRETENIHTKFVNLFAIYDNAAEAIHKGYKYVEDAKIVFDCDKMDRLRDYTKKIKYNELNLIATEVLKDLSLCIRNKDRMKETLHIVCSVVMKGYIIEAPETIINSHNDSPISLTRIHQHFFRTMATHGCNKLLFDGLVTIFENEKESLARRKGAVFWARKLVEGFLILRDIQKLEKKQTELNSKKKIDLTMVNRPNTTKAIGKLYNKINANIDDSLLFTDTEKKPQTLVFSKAYITQRVLAVTDFSFGLIENCLNLVEPPFTPDEWEETKNLIEIYLGLKRISTNSSIPDSVFTMEKDILKLNGVSEAMDVDQLPQLTSTTTFGMWAINTDTVDWSSCPLGTLPWQ